MLLPALEGVARGWWRSSRTSLLGDVLNFPIPHLGNSLGAPDLGDDFREPVRSRVPTLLLSGTLDGRTYPESAREIAARFANGTHVIVENGGHNLLEASPLVGEVIVSYMKGEEPRSATLALPPPKIPDQAEDQKPSTPGFIKPCGSTSALIRASSASGACDSAARKG